MIDGQTRPWIARLPRPGPGPRAGRSGVRLALVILLLGSACSASRTRPDGAAPPADAGAPAPCVASCDLPSFIGALPDEAGVGLERILGAASLPGRLAVLTVRNPGDLGDDEALIGRSGYALLTFDWETGASRLAPSDRRLLTRSTLVAGAIRSRDGGLEAIVLQSESGPPPSGVAGALTRILWSESGDIVDVSELGAVSLGRWSCRCPWYAAVAMNRMSAAVVAMDGRTIVGGAFSLDPLATLRSGPLAVVSSLPAESSGGPLGAALTEGGELGVVGGGQEWPPDGAEAFFASVPLSSTEPAAITTWPGSRDDPRPVVAVDGPALAVARYASDHADLRGGTVIVEGLSAGTMLGSAYRAPTAGGLPPIELVAQTSSDGAVVGWSSHALDRSRGATFHLLPRPAGSVCGTVEVLAAVALELQPAPLPGAVALAAHDDGLFVVLAGVDPGAAVTALWLPRCVVAPSP